MLATFRMLKNYLNWKNFLVLIAVSIAALSLYFANNLTKKLATEEKKRVELISLALESTVKTNGELGNIVESKLIADNTTIPLIWTDEHQQIIDVMNLDTLGESKEVYHERIEALKKLHPPIVITAIQNQRQFIYYGESELLQQLRFFPYVLLVILFLFLLVVASFINTSGRQIQDRVWVGMSKETAHQLGTPLTSLVAWIEYLKDTHIEQEALLEMNKDVERLQLIADRFSKIGSVPQLFEEQLMDHLRGIVSYMEKRASKNVKFSIRSNKEDVLVVISGPLFDWVVENLIRNSLDAMDGHGAIHLEVRDEITQTIIDVSDTGKGISASNIKKVFKPGFSTKKRGWGLGLSLAKRIMSEYHYGDIFVKKSELGKGTTFRIILKR
ncbi:MAG TPA: HAMP domain-containing sensor histidine kinase [Chitinophagaceae bacterium]|nr:HAMP domain-containing sensor histidine kinase [Chitinophagaceae bacterium]